MKQIIFTISNIAAAPKSKVEKILESKIPQYLHTVYKITKCNNVILEIIITFNNLIFHADFRIFKMILKYEPLRIFCETLKYSNLLKVQKACLSGIYKFLKHFFNFSTQEVKYYEIEVDNILPIVESLAANSKNEEIIGYSHALLQRINDCKHNNVEFDSEQMHVEMQTDK